MFAYGDVGLVLLGVGYASEDARDSVLPVIPSRWASAVRVLRLAGLDVGDFVSMVAGLPDDVVIDLLDKIVKDYDLNCEVL